MPPSQPSGTGTGRAPWPGDAWPKATPESQGLSRTLLEQAPAKAKVAIGNAIVIRYGYDVWHYGDAYEANDWWASCMRTYMTTLFGMLIHRGVITGGQAALDRPVNQLASARAKRFSDAVKLKHLLSYTSCSDPPGTAWSYGCNYVAMEEIFRELTGKLSWEYLNEQLLPVLGGKRWKGIYKHRPGEPEPGLMRVVGPAADVARWAYLWMRMGNWNGVSVVDPWFAAKTVLPLAKDKGAGDVYADEGWQIHLNHAGKWRGLPRDCYAALGAWATGVILACPSLDLVIARSGVRPRGPDQIEEFLGPILAAVDEHRANLVPREEESYFPPPDQAGGWRRPRDNGHARQVAGVDMRRLDEAFAYVQETTKNGGLLVARRGWLVYEKYFGLGDPEIPPNLASCAKSVTSIAVGILMSERPELFPEGLDQKVYDPKYLPPGAFPLADPRKAEIKLGQLLSMTAGIRGNNPTYVLGKRGAIDPVGPDGWESCDDAVAFGKRDGVHQGEPFSAATLWTAPGDGYSYATSSIHLGSVMLRHVTGMELEAYVGERLAKPMGWGRWTYGYKHQPLEHTPGGGGIALRPRDMLRFAYLLLRGGRWGDKALVPEDYVHQASRKTRYNPHTAYSFQFDVNTDGGATGLPRDAFWKGGSGGHVFLVVPSLDLVVFKLGGRDEQYAPANTGFPKSEKANTRPDVPEVASEVHRGRYLRALNLVVAALDR